MNRRIDQIRNGPYIMYLFLLIQTVVFLAMTAYGFHYGLGFYGSLNTSILMKFGAQNNQVIYATNEWWRLITPMFVHIGFSHFLFNSLTLYFLGAQVESVFGHARFFWIYMLSGFMGNVLSFGFGNLNAVSAGASTSLFGLFGVYLSLQFMEPRNPYIRSLAQSYMFLIIFNLIFNLFSPNISLTGHLGGLFGGVLSSYAISLKHPSEPQSKVYRGVAVFAYVVLLILSLVIGINRVTNIM